MVGPSNRTLRLRADGNLREMVRRPNPDGAGELVVPTREALVVGHEVTLEISFGPMADEVEVEGIVTRVDAQAEGEPALVTIYVVKSDMPRMRYVLDVLEGRRVPTARRYRRIDAEVDVRWWWGLQAHPQRARGLSIGGTFIPGEAAPKVGFRTEVELRPSSRTVPLRIPATVVWMGDTVHGPGFGVQFQMTDARLAERLRTLVRDLERVSKDVVSLSRS